MGRYTKLLTLAGLLWLWFGLPVAAHAQFLIIGDDNKLHWDDTGKTVFTEPGKDEVVIVDIGDRPADQPRDHARREPGAGCQFAGRSTGRGRLEDSTRRQAFRNRFAVEAPQVDCNRRGRQATLGHRD
jgi:hypothetical protein